MDQMIAIGTDRQTEPASINKQYLHYLYCELSYGPIAGHYSAMFIIVNFLILLY